MALDDILSAIAEEAQEVISAMESGAAERAAEALAVARRRAEAERDRLSHGRDEAASQAAARIVNMAKLEADRALRAAQDQLFEGLVDEVALRLASLRESPAYGELFERLLTEAYEVLPDATWLDVTAADLDRAREVVGRMGAHLSVRSGVPGWGGVEVSTEDGRAVRNTLESRLAKARPALRRLAAGICPELVQPAGVGVETAAGVGRGSSPCVVEGAG